MWWGACYLKYPSLGLGFPRNRLRWRFRWRNCLYWWRGGGALGNNIQGRSKGSGSRQYGSLNCHPTATEGSACRTGESESGLALQRYPPNRREGWAFILPQLAVSGCWWPGEGISLKARDLPWAKISSWRETQLRHWVPWSQRGNLGFKDRLWCTPPVRPLGSICSV